jgi:hypothetical protein
MALVLYAIAANDAQWQLPVTEADGSPKDLTAATDLVFLVKRRVDDADEDAVVSATPVVADAEGGILEVRLEPADTAALPAGEYVWAIQFADGTGALWEFPGPSLAPGRFLVRASVVATVPAP